MTLTPVKQAQYSFEDYLHHNTDSEHRYELVDGELMLMNPPTIRHFLIAKYLEACFDREIQNQSLPWLCLREAGVRTGWKKSRLADLLVIDREQVKQKLDQTAIFQVPPLLSVEIVIPDSRKRDYRYKRSEYAAIGIVEYWIVDPDENTVTGLNLEDGFYEATIFTQDENIISVLLPQLILTADQILAAGNLA